MITIKLYKLKILRHLFVIVEICIFLLKLMKIAKKNITFKLYF